MPQSKDPYKILGVSRDAGKEDIKRAYYRMARKYHPDQHLGNTYAEEMFKDVASAYEVLSDDELRARYDQGPGYRTPTPARNPDPWRRTAQETSPETIEAIMGLFAAREDAFRSEGWFNDLGVSGRPGRKRMLWFAVGTVVAFVFTIFGLALVASVLDNSTSGTGGQVPFPDGEYPAKVVSVSERTEEAFEGPVTRKVVRLEVTRQVERGTGSVFTDIDYRLRSNLGAGYIYDHQPGTVLTVIVQDGKVVGFY
ncbi:MAG: J domain-containing protein [Actinobacteria bacterium]|nr:J domain-containing protein [Actinomycetota bacterium]MBU1944698.1 J domain-containing protein [Actinomycetota bacterium]MBU2689246.1 J domain-containing protein [Actinomycetota bacterium]